MSPDREPGGRWRSVRRTLLGLRLEEMMTFLLFIPTAYALARLSFQPDPTLPLAARGYPAPELRLVVLILTVVGFALVIRLKPRWEILRDAMPFLFAGNIYANLHDLIRFYGAPDITGALYRWDMWLFGAEPTVWAQQFNHPVLTDFFTFCYWLFYVLPPMLGLFLYLRRDRIGFRATMVSVVLCLYLGYVGYVALPASAPRLFIPEAYEAALRGSMALDYTREAVAAIPLTARGAFPSLHCSVMLLSIFLAWRYLRWFFWVQLFFGTGLILGTVYLRHHWVVDILAGFILTLFSLWAGPRLERWWESIGRRSALELAPTASSGNPREGLIEEAIPRSGEGSA